MNKKFAALGALAGVVAVGGSAVSAAQAGILVPAQTQGFGVGAEPGAQFAGEGAESFMEMDSDAASLTFDLFDPTNGTLTGVKISVEFGGNNQVFSSSELTAEPAQGDNVNAASDAFLTFGTAGEQFLSFASEVGGNCDPMGANECSFEPSAEFSDADVQMNFKIDDFVGDGTFDVDVDIKVTLSGSVTGFYTGSANAFAFVEGAVSVEYDYIPAGTPISEPATLALLGGSIVGLGLARRRRKAA